MLAGQLLCNGNTAMGFQPNRDYISNDDIQTPVELAGRIVEYFKPMGRVLEPCAGDGYFLRHLSSADWCEIKQGVIFYHTKGMWTGLLRIRLGVRCGPCS